MENTLKYILNSLRDLENYVFSELQNTEKERFKLLFHVVKNDNDMPTKTIKSEVDEMLKIKGVSISSKPRFDGRYQGYILEFGRRKYFYGSSKDEIAIKIKTYFKKGVNNKNSNDLTLKDWSNKWFTLYKKPNLKPKSLLSIQNSLKHLFRGFGNSKLTELNANDLQAFFFNPKSGALP